MMILGSALGIYIATIVYTRICGKRSFSKISSFDFAMTVAIGSVIATTVMSKSVSLVEGMVSAAVVYTLQLSFAFLRRYPTFKKLIDNEPTLLMEGSRLMTGNMKKVRVTEDDIRSKLRKANVKNRNEVKVVIFETTGDIVVIHGEDSTQIEDWLLKDVQH